METILSKLIRIACLLVWAMAGSVFVMAASAQDNLQTNTVFGALADSPLWAAYKKQFVGSKGNVIDNVNGGISHSESQGYGMLLAIAANDKAAFDLIYSFTSNTLAVRSDALHSWRYTPTAQQAVSDTNNASDGDILIAWALLEASEAGWGQNHRDKALEILTDLEPQMSEWPEIGLILAPGEMGFDYKKTGLIANLSYWVFPAFERLAHLTGARRWLRLQASGEQLIDQFVIQKQGRVPDWILLKKGHVNALLAPEKPPLFGYEAIRIPLYLLMSETGNKDLALAIIKAAQTASGQKLQVLDIESGKAEDVFKDAGYDTIVSLAHCHDTGTPIRSSLMQSLDQNYYPATLQLLALAAAKQRYASCL
ncbi:cellulase [Cohaesibacter celericrescens]|uniref:cellulase n=1 Tax=Cohaesibacter celericrescens TaxID=2067669 RepID=A0A2N5XV55_9HYPH|nr:cellulase [Cohaesibacter celericrescens]